MLVLFLVFVIVVLLVVNFALGRKIHKSDSKLQENINAVKQKAEKKYSERVKSIIED